MNLKRVKKTKPLKQQRQKMLMKAEKKRIVKHEERFKMVGFSALCTLTEAVQIMRLH